MSKAVAVNLRKSFSVDILPEIAADARAKAAALGVTLGRYIEDLILGENADSRAGTFVHGESMTLARVGAALSQADAALISERGSLAREQVRFARRIVVERLRTLQPEMERAEKLRVQRARSEATLVVGSRKDTDVYDDDGATA